MTLMEEFAAFAATKSGPYQTEDNCRCPMAEFARHKWPTAVRCSAGEASIVAWRNEHHELARDEFPDGNFFTKFVEPFHTWENLTAALRRAI